MYAIIILCMISCHVFVPVDTLKAACCICDDLSQDPSVQCTSDNVCSNNYTFCDVCEYRRKFVERKWHITRTCSNESKCALDLYQTSITLGCIDNTLGEPNEGTACYTCCKLELIHYPFYCVDNIDTHGNFSIPYTETTTPTIKMTTSPTTTTTTTTTTTPAPTTKMTTTPTTTTTTTTTTTPAPTTTMTTTPTTTTTTTTTTTPAPTTTMTTTPTTTSTTTTPTPTTTTPLITTHPPTKPVSCETCLSGNCTNPRTITCGNGEQYCMNTVISDGVTTKVKKACATQMECYYDSNIAMKYKPECKGTTGKTGNQSYVCHYCCEAKTGPSSACNTDIIPQHQAVFDPSGSHDGTVCEVGRDNNFENKTCNGLTPFCMNTVILQTDVNITKKTCESEILCNQDWWELTRNRKNCMQTNSSMLPVLDEGLVCHYCCKSGDGQPCNTELIPSDAQTVIAKSVDGGWSEWTAWTGCSQYCTGIQDRHRRCDNPVPGVYGTNCQGRANEQENCDSNTNCQISATGSQALIGR